MLLQILNQVRQCNSSNCRACGSKHHTLLHLGNLLSFSSQGAQLQEALPSASPSALHSTSTALIAQEFSNDIVLLATARVLLKNSPGVFVPCRALLDSGSQLHLITCRFANQLQVKKIKSSASVTGIGDSRFVTDNHSVNITIQSRTSEYLANITPAGTYPKIYS